jgi:hypothetical protein
LLVIELPARRCLTLAMPRTTPAAVGQLAETLCAAPGTGEQAAWQ